jgi:hypothetical protein
MSIKDTALHVAACAGAAALCCDRSVAAAAIIALATDKIAKLFLGWGDKHIEQKATQQARQDITNEKAKAEAEAEAEAAKAKLKQKIASAHRTWQAGW